jgi:parallel beta-helix repeat protein
MRSSVFVRVVRWCLLGASAALVVFLVGGPLANARGPGLNAWESLYSGVSGSGDVAQCQLCHANDPADASWNQYGWDIASALGTPGCDTSWETAILCVEGDASVSEVPGTYTYLEEIQASAQPGWTAADANTIYTNSGDLFDQPPFPGLEPYDPAGTGGMGGEGGMGGGGGMGGAGGDCPTTGTIPPEQIGDGTITVMPGQSIQEAIDLAPENTRIEIQPGVYEEACNTTNGLNVTKSGIHLIGLSTSAAGPDSIPEERVIVRSTGNQRNGIVIVPPEVPAEAQPLFSAKVERTDCMGCHSDMAPPFPLHSDVPRVIPKQNDAWLTDILVEGITIQGFENNGLFTEHVDGFTFRDVESRDNRNYGIFPVLSSNGLIEDSYSTGSDLDSGLWVETSENVDVLRNLVENSVNGIEVSNSDDILLVDNEARNNTVGAAILLLPDIYENRGSAKRIDMQNNWLHDNNKPNTARPGSILAEIPSGIGIIYLGVDDSVASGNLVENNDFAGIAISDYCIPLLGTEFACTVDPTITPEFLADEKAENNRVVDNELNNNATNIDPDSPFAIYAADLVLITGNDHGNCFANNDFTTSFSFIGRFPPCPEDPGTGGVGGMGGAGGTGGAEAPGDDGGCSCVVGGPSPFRFSTTWLIVCGAFALLLRRRLRRPTASPQKQEI